MVTLAGEASGRRVLDEIAPCDLHLEHTGSAIRIALGHRQLLEVTLGNASRGCR